MSGNYVQALALGIAPGWRRLPAAERRAGIGALEAVLAEQSEVTTFTYSMIGLQAGSDLLLWSLAPSLDALEESAAAILRTPLGAWMTVRESFLGLIQPSQYVKRPTEQEQSLFSGERSRYLIVYPFTKDTAWYLLGKEARQGVMNEHIKVGHQYPRMTMSCTSTSWLVV